MKKNGFTIIELIVIIGILGMSIAFAVPSLYSSVQKSKLKEFNRLKSQFETAAETYFLNNDVQTDYITLDTLADEGFIEYNINNQLTSRSFNYATLVHRYTKSNGVVTYEYTNVTYSPILDKTTYEYGDNFSISPTDVETSGTVTVRFNNMTLTTPYNMKTANRGTYEITYLINENGGETTLTRFITIN